MLEASFSVNAFVLLSSAAVLATENARQGRNRGAKALTAVEMRSALMEGLELGICFTCMIMWPESIAVVSWFVAGGACVSIVQRTLWVIGALRTIDEGNVGEGVKANVSLKIK